MEETSENSSNLQVSTQRKKKNKVKDKRRFSDAQIRSLETIFEAETKLEPRKKQQVAKELGLHPRQVAIWFQNKRARWKSKQIEQEYRRLQANYDNLASKFECLKIEKQSLLAQLQELGELLGKPDVNENSRDGGSENGEQDQGNLNLNVGFQENGPLGAKIDNVSDFGHESQELPSIGEYPAAADNSLASPVEWCAFDEGGMIDQYNNSLNWMNFWS